MSPSGAFGRYQYVRRFHAYCSAPAAAHRMAIATMRGANIDRHPRGAAVSRKTVYAGASRIIDR